jgi:hypothetical protein
MTIHKAPGARPAYGAARPALGQLAAPSVVAVMALARATCGCGSHAANVPSEALQGAVLPRDLIIPLSTVKDVLPEMSRETATGRDETAVGNPTGTRSVTHATADGSQRVVISVDQYPSGDRETPGEKGG